MPEPFWKIVLKYGAPEEAQPGGHLQQLRARQAPLTEFFWARGRLFDHGVAALLYEMCLEAGTATVTKARRRRSQPRVLR